MDLKNFISEALCQIVTGIKSAQEKIGKVGKEEPFNKAYIAPMSGLESENEIYDVYFDIALAVFTEEASQSSEELHVLGLSSLNGKGPAEHLGSLVSRVRFSVPVIYPSMLRQTLSSPYHYH